MQPSAPAGSVWKKYRRLFIGVPVLLAGVYALKSFSPPDCSTIQAQIEGWGFLAPVAFFLLYVLATVAFIPGLLVTLLAGLIFGPWWGTLIVSLASTFGATLAFLIARYIARDAVEGLLSKQGWFAKFKDSVEANGFNFVVFVRLVPLFPFNGLNYACGLVPLKLSHYVVGSMLGMLPGTFAYVYLGSAGCKLIDSMIQGTFTFKDFPPEVRNSLIVSIVLLALLSVLPLVVKKFRRRA